LAVFGVGALTALAQVMASLLFGVGVRDPITFVDVGALLLVASFVPAFRATRVDPVVALRA
jgi:putative ABC transport system permease protein